MSPLLGRYRGWASTLKSLHSQRKLFLNSTFSTTTTSCNDGDSNDSTSNRSPTQPNAPPIEVLLTESAGRGVFATRRIGAGQLIHTAEPIVSHPSLSEMDNVCYFCLKKITKLDHVQHQTRCTSFCSDICRDQAKDFFDIEMKTDWSAYNEYCRSKGLKYPLMVKRLACMIISGVASSNSLDILQPAILSPQMISQMEEEFRLLKSAFAKAKINDDHISFLSKQWYTNVLARIRINAFRIELAVGGSYEDLMKLAVASVNSEIAVGNAVYILSSFYNHDCDPNTHIVWIDNVTARMKALREIEQGEELRICYIDASMNRDARQALLFEGFGFQCRCLRCLSGD